MKKTIRLLVAPISFSLFLSTSILAQATQNHPAAKPTVPVDSRDDLGRPDVIIVSTAPLTGYSTYREGDYFYVVVPESCDPQIQMWRPGPGFQDARVQRRLEQVVLSLSLLPGVTPRTRHFSNRVEISLVPFERADLKAAEGERSHLTPTRASLRLDAPDGEKEDSLRNPGTIKSPESASVAASAQVVPGAPSPGPKGGSELDLSVPESPAFTVLGLTPQTVIRPATPRALATSLLNGFDREGNFQSGVAIDTAPYMLFAGEGLTLAEYRSSPVTRIIARSQVSFATTKGSSEADKSARLALGFHVTVWDKGDPRMDQQLTQCFRDSLSLDLPGTPEQQELLLRPRWSKCQEESRKRNWNRSSWVFGAAPSWISATGNIRDARWNGGGVWTSLAYGFEGVPVLRDTSQLIFHARYRTEEKLPDPSEKGRFFTQDSLFLGSRLRLGVPDFVANVEGVYIRNKPEGGSADDSYRISAGAERRLTKDLWLSLTFGGEGGHRNGRNQAFVLTTFKYAFSRGPQ